MFWRSVILLLSITVAWPLPRASSTAELRQLARLPKVEFASPLVFDRKSGFVAFPDAATAAAESAGFLLHSKASPREASLYLDTACRLEANGDFLGALKYYSWSADLFRKRLAIEPESAPDLAGLAQSLVSIGRGAEAQTHLDKALDAAPEDPAVLAAAARVLRERAWQAAAGEQRFFSPSTFLDSVSEILRDAPEPARIVESQRFLDRSVAAIQRAAALAPGDAMIVWQHAVSLSFEAAFREALAQVQAGDAKISQVQSKLFSEPAMGTLLRAARMEGQSPGLVAAGTLAILTASATANSGRDGSLLAQNHWAQLPPAVQSELRGMAALLESMAGGTSTNSAAASEQLGCVQLCVIRDYEGAQRSFRQALAREPGRHRSWELLVLASFLAGAREELVEICSSRVNSLPTARSTVLLAKAYERSADASRAELVALTGLSAHPNDFFLNLTLAALLVKRESGDGLWRVPELVRKAEKQIGRASTPQNRLDLALIKSISLALAGKPDEAREAIKPYLAGSSEAQELLRVLER